MVLFVAARARCVTHRTHMHSTAKDREAVMTDDGSQPPSAQLTLSLIHI